MLNKKYHTLHSNTKIHRVRTDRAWGKKFAAWWYRLVRHEAIALFVYNVLVSLDDNNI